MFILKYSIVMFFLILILHVVKGFFFFGFFLYRNSFRLSIEVNKEHFHKSDN